MLARRPVDDPRAKALQHRHQRTRHHPGADQPDQPAAQLADPLLQAGTDRPPLPRPARAVQRRDIAQCRQHQQQRGFRDRRRVGAGHVAHRDAARPRRVEIDRVDPDADLLDEPQTRRPRDHRLGHRPQDMQQNLGIGQQCREPRIIILGAGCDAKSVACQCGQPCRQERPGIVMEDRFHRTVAARSAIRRPERSSSDAPPQIPPLDENQIATSLALYGPARSA